MVGLLEMYEGAGTEAELLLKLFHKVIGELEEDSEARVKYDEHWISIIGVEVFSEYRADWYISKEELVYQYTIAMMLGEEKL